MYYSGKEHGGRGEIRQITRYNNRRLYGNGDGNGNRIVTEKIQQHCHKTQSQQDQMYELLLGFNPTTAKHTKNLVDIIYKSCNCISIKKEVKVLIYHTATTIPSPTPIKNITKDFLTNKRQIFSFFL